MTDDSSPAAAVDDERELVDAYLRHRGEGAFRALYRRHTPRLYRLALRLVGGDREAEDAVQETWIRAAERFDSFAWRSSLATWLTGIAVNVCRDRLRHDRARPRPVLDAPPKTVDTAGPAPGDDCRLDLERALESLPGRYRQVLVLHDVEGYSHREIAGFLGIEAGTSKSQLFHARRAMRRRLAQEG